VSETDIKDPKDYWCALKKLGAQCGFRPGVRHARADGNLASV
jgi:hypothetical protein